VVFYPERVGATILANELSWPAVWTAISATVGPTAGKPWQTISRKVVGKVRLRKGWHGQWRSYNRFGMSQESDRRMFCCCMAKKARLQKSNKIQKQNWNLFCVLDSEGVVRPQVELLGVLYRLLGPIWMNDAAETIPWNVYRQWAASKVLHPLFGNVSPIVNSFLD
jgi:hypothetical protein